MASQQGLFQQLRARAGCDDHMPFIAILLERQSGAHAGMVRIREAYPILHIALLLVHAASKPRHVSYRKVGFAGFERPLRIPVDPRRFQPDVRGLRTYVRQQTWKQRDVAGVRHVDPKAPLGRGGSKEISQAANRRSDSSISLHGPIKASA